MFYTGLLKVPIPNYGMITQEEFSEKDYGNDEDTESESGENDGLNDGLWCQSSNSGSNIGAWIRPDGQTVDPFTSSTGPLYVLHSTGQVGLMQREAIDGDPFQGLYKCIIPDETGENQTLVIWIGGNDIYAENYRGLSQSWKINQCTNNNSII